ncbi:MAG: energy-coupling factor ABC transporter permease [Verrucomicrobiae bacterium]|nr:energy-coupling factor ABC transporter permease [Verrucomicrobiae bacterium]
MHIPDGFLDLKTAVGSAVVAGAGLATAARAVTHSLPQRKVPLLGVAAAFIFAAQMLNFPVLGGTSGHLIGGTLAALLIGIAPAVIAMTAVLVVQCFVFADGGVTALGANVFNMALVAPMIGYAAARLVQRAVPGQRGMIAGAAFGGWCSTVAAATSCAAQLALSGIVAWHLVLPAMAGVHMLIGVGEGSITALVLAGVLQMRPELLNDSEADKKQKSGSMAMIGLVVALGLAVFVGPFASPLPDGLEKVAETLGFASAAADAPVVPAPIPEYELPGLRSPVLAVALAGALGTVIVFGLALLLARALVPKNRSTRD